MVGSRLNPVLPQSAVAEWTACEARNILSETLLLNLLRGTEAHVAGRLARAS